MSDNSEDEIDWEQVFAQMREAEARDRGYASYGEWPLDRRLGELGVVRTLAAYLAFSEGISWASAEPVQDDPPDVLLTTTRGRRFGVEVTELVSAHAAKLDRHRKKTGKGSPYDWAHWTAETAAQAIARIVETKERKLASKKASYDEFLLGIATDEPMISFDLAQEAVRLCRPQVKVIDRIFLLMSYDPAADKRSYPDGCPVLSVSVGSD